MTRFADPHHCPSCSSQIVSNSCQNCGVSFDSAEARELWATLNHADVLLARLEASAREPNTSATATRATVGATGGPGTTPQTGTLLPTAPAIPTRPTKRRWSAGSIILALGALCLLVASFVFISVAWAILGLLGRTLVLLVITAVVAAVAAAVSARALRASSEAMWAIAIGMVALDYWASRTYGLARLDQLSQQHAVFLFGALITALGFLIAVWVRPRLQADLVVAQMAAVIGTYVACAGVNIAGVNNTYLALIAGGLGLVSTTALWKVNLHVAAAAAALAPLLAYVIALTTAAEAVIRTNDAATLWRGPAWQMVATIVVTIVVGVGVQFVLRGKAHALLAPTLAAAIATGATAWVLYAPFSDVEGAVNQQAVAIVFGLVTIAIATALYEVMPGDARGSWSGGWNAGMRIAALIIALPLVGHGLYWIFGEAAPNVVRSISTGEWTAPVGTTIDLEAAAPPGWLAAAVLVALALGLLLIARWPVPAPAGHSTGSMLHSAAAALVITAALIELAVNEVPVIVFALAVTAVGTLALWWGLQHARPVVRWAGIALMGMAAFSVLGSSAASMCTWASLGLITGFAAWQTARHADRLMHGVLSAAAALLFSGTVVAATHTAGFQVRWQVLALTVAVAATALGAQALRTSTLSRLTVEAVAAAGFLAALFWAAADTSLGWQSLLWTLTGATLVVIALMSSDRRIAAAVGSTALAVAYILRLAASDISVVEAYTLPIGIALLIAGVAAMLGLVTSFGFSSSTTKPPISSWTALGAGLTLSLLPSLPQVFEDPTTLRGLLLGLGVLATLAVGLLRRWQAPFVMGAGLTFVLAVRHLGPYADAVPRWMLIGVVGVGLLLVGITWESRVKNAKSAAGYVSAMR